MFARCAGEPIHAEARDTMQFSPLEDWRLAHRTDATCRRCTHSLIGLPGRFCPQCGAERGSDSRTTIPRPTESPPTWARHFLKPPGPWFHGFVLSGCGSALLAGAPPGGLAPAAAIAVGVITLLALVWVIRLGALALTLLFVGFRHAPRNALMRLVIAPLLVAITALIVAADLPSRITFRLSRPALNRWVTRVLHGDRTALRQRWIGLYPARDISFTEDGVWFRTPWTMPNGGSGFVYCPYGRPEDSGELTFRGRDGGWYEWFHNY